jgi:hypothetical protein
VIAEPDKPPLALTFDNGMASVLANTLPVLRHHEPCAASLSAASAVGWPEGTSIKEDSNAGKGLRRSLLVGTFDLGKPYPSAKPDTSAQRRQTRRGRAK